MEKHPLHLKNPELQTSSEVKRAVKKQEIHAQARNQEIRENHKEGPLEREKLPNDPTERIEAYMNRLKNIFLDPDINSRQRNLHMFEGKIDEALLIKPKIAIEEILKDEAKVALDRGHGRLTITEEMKERPDVKEQAAGVIQRQKESLKQWMDYLTSDDASSYDPWFKYYLWNSITKLQSLVKTEKTNSQTGEKSITAEYPKRTASTLKPFPDIYRGKLSQIYDKYTQYLKGEKTDQLAKEYFQKNFSKIYAEESLDHITNVSPESKEQIDGEWIKYNKGDMADAERMVASLQNKYTDWCIEGANVAQDKLKEGDIHIYYTYDKTGNPVDPRLCIRMSNDNIAEVRGVSGGKSQEIEQVFMDETSEGGSILDTKLKEFGAKADAYRKREADMKHMTRLMKKQEQQVPFTKEDLVFLYELNSPIEGFGYHEDPRVGDLLEKRKNNIEKDLLVIFDCTSESEIAHNLSQIDQNTKVYFGPLYPGVLEKMPEHIENIYTSFPENKILRTKIDIRGKTMTELISEMKVARIGLNIYPQDVLASREFPGSQQEQITLVQLTLADLGFGGVFGNFGNVTTQQIYERAKELGLELCSTDIGLEYGLKYNNQVSEDLHIAMEQIVFGDHSLILKLHHDSKKGQLEVNFTPAAPEESWGWTKNSKFLFRLGKTE